MKGAVDELERPPAPAGKLRKKARGHAMEHAVWPNDCPKCRQRMEFSLGAVTRRVCRCGFSMTAADCWR